MSLVSIAVTLQPPFGKGFQVGLAAREVLRSFCMGLLDYSKLGRWKEG